MLCDLCSENVPEGTVAWDYLTPSRNAEDPRWLICVDCHEIVAQHRAEVFDLNDTMFFIMARGIQNNGGEKFFVDLSEELQQLILTRIASTVHFFLENEDRNPKTVTV